MKLAVTYYRNLTRWDVKNFLLAESLTESHVRLGSFLQKRQDQWGGTGNSPMLSLHFGGDFSERESNKIKGKLFVANAGDLVYSKIDLRNGAIGIIPDGYPNALFTAEFPIYKINIKVIHPIYLQLYLQSDNFKRLINSVVSGSSGRKRVKPSDFEKLFIFVPPMDIQQNIVKKWQSAQAEAIRLIQKAEKQETHIDEYFYHELSIKSDLSSKKKGPFLVRHKHLCRWDVQFFASELNLGGNFVPLHNAIKMETEKLIPLRNKRYFYVGLEDIEKNTGKFLAKECSGEQIKSQSAILKNGHIYYAKLRPYLNKVILFDNLSKDYISSGEVFGFTVKDGCEKKYVYYCLLSKIIKDQIKNLMIGARMPRISEDAFENLKILLPPLAKQKEIARKVSILRSEVLEMKEGAKKVVEKSKQEIEKILKQ